MADNRKLAGGVLAMVLVGAAAFVGLYLMIQRASSRMPAHPAPPAEASGGDAAAPASPAPAPAGESAPATEAAPPAAAPASAPSQQPAPQPVGASERPSHPAAAAEPASEPPPAPSEDAATSSQSMASDQINLSLDEESLKKFLAVKQKIWVVYQPHRPDFALLNEDLGELRTESKKAMMRAAAFVPMQDARRAGLAETGLDEAEYKRIARVVYDFWWRATAANVNIDERVAEARAILDRAEREIAKPGQPHIRIHHLSARRTLAMDEIGRLEWARSHPAKELLEKIPVETRAACDRHAKEIDDLAMKEGNLLLY